jgi:hypothetical protein
MLTLLISLMPLSTVRAQDDQPCPYPEGYLDAVFDDLTRIGEEIAQVDTTDPAAISLFYVQTYQLRHRYENMTPNLPDCALRGHTYFTNILGNWEDILGLALATHANPAAADQYIAELTVINDRITFFTPYLLEEFFPPLPPTPIAPTPTQPTVLNTFYVATEGLNVRAGAGAEFESLGVLTGGTPVQVVALDTLENGDTWYEIIFPDSPTGTGWVFGPFVSPERPAQFPQPLPTMTPEGTGTPEPDGFQLGDADPENGDEQ